MHMSDIRWRWVRKEMESMGGRVSVSVPGLGVIGGYINNPDVEEDK
jgi:hypothetical protein